MKVGEGMKWLWLCLGEQEIYFKFLGQSSDRKSDILEIGIQCDVLFHENLKKNIFILENELKLVWDTLGTHF